MSVAKPNKIVLTYFPFPGRAGPIREALRHGKIDFEDRHVTHAEFASLKETYPFGQLPLLEVDGVVITQSNAQLVYAGRLAGLTPNDAFPLTQVLEVLSFVEDAISLVVPSMREKVESKRLAMRKELSAEDGPLRKFFFRVNRYLERNGKGNGWFVGDTLTVADLKTKAFFEMVSSGHLDGIPTDILEKYAAIKQNIAQTTAALK
jgi:prostaglandin-H2 D-isomerase / glutathione transferase